MANPKRRLTGSRRDKRRSQIRLAHTATQKCPKCGDDMMPHRACPKCGTYAGKQVVNVLKKLEKKQKRAKKAEAAK